MATTARIITVSVQYSSHMMLHLTDTEVKIIAFEAIRQHLELRRCRRCRHQRTQCPLFSQCRRPSRTLFPVKRVVITIVTIIAIAHYQLPHHPPPSPPSHPTKKMPNVIVYPLYPPTHGRWSYASSMLTLPVFKHCAASTLANCTPCGVNSKC